MPNIDCFFVRPPKMDPELYEKTDVEAIQFYFIYVNAKNEVEKITEDIYELNDPNVLSTSEICAIIEQNKLMNNITYSLSDILKYNFTLEPADILRGLDAPISASDITDSTTLIKINGINDVIFEPTITYFQPLNSIYIILKERVAPSPNRIQTHRHTPFWVQHKRTRRNTKQNVLLSH